MSLNNVWEAGQQIPAGRWQGTAALMKFIP